MANRKMRKPPRKKPDVPKIKIDDDLATLAAAIAEHQLENNASGWFVLPWRNGWNAVTLARGVWLTESKRVLEQFPTFRDNPIIEAADALLAKREQSSEGYHRAEDLLHGAGWIYGFKSRAMRAALRCYQILVADAHGGGHVYNDILRPVFDETDPKNWEELIMFWRCNDAIGTPPRLCNDHLDPIRNAFKIAWSRGLYHAAYSLKGV